MQMINKIILIAILITIFCCETSSIPNYNIIGTWQSTCSWDSFDRPGYNIIVVSFSNTTLKRDQSFFTDSTCTNGTFKSINVYDFITSNNMPLDNNIEILDLTVKSTFLSIQSIKKQLQFNQNSAGGKSNWLLNEEVLMTGLSYPFGEGSQIVTVTLPQNDDQIYTSLKITSGILYIGLLGYDGTRETVPANRPYSHQ